LQFFVIEIEFLELPKKKPPFKSEERPSQKPIYLKFEVLSKRNKLS
jgi:hypothetical protein